MKTKICKKCGHNKTLEHFKYHKTSTSTKQQWCNECIDEDPAGYEQMKIDNTKAYMKRYRETHKEYFREYQKEYQKIYNSL